MHHDIYILLTHPTQPRLLLHHTADGWTLPLIQLESDERVIARVTALLDAIRQQLGMEVTVLRRMRAFGNPFGEGVTHLVSIFEVENHRSDAAPREGSRWVGAEEVQDMAFPDSRQQEAVSAWFAAQNTPPPELRAAWAHKGWFAHASAWMQEQLLSLGYSVTGPVEQIKQWGISVVLRVPTTTGMVFFKALPPFFRIEPIITDVLARWYPDYLPRVLAIEPSRRWMLQAGFSGPFLEDSPRPAWEIALRELAQIQTECVPRVAELLRLGCEDRRLEVLAAQIDPFLAHPSLEELGGLTTEEVNRLRVLAPRLKTLCATVAGYGLPATLIHGDFHSGNVVVSADHCILYDWSDACVAHPFIDLYTVFLSNYPDALQEDMTPLRNLYLSAWTSFAPLETLVALYEMIAPLAAFHLALSYRTILEGLESDSRNELRGGLWYWLSKVMEMG